MREGDWSQLNNQDTARTTSTKQLPPLRASFVIGAHGDATPVKDGMTVPELKQWATDYALDRRRRGISPVGLLQDGESAA